MCKACGFRFVTWETHDPKFHIPRVYENPHDYTDKRKNHAKRKEDATNN